VEGNFTPFLAQTPEDAARSTLQALTTKMPSGTYIAPQHCMLVGTPRVTKVRKKGRDPIMARRLWELSAELTGCDWTEHPIPSAMERNEL